jgi:hypothetical protein
MMRTHDETVVGSSGFHHTPIGAITPSTGTRRRSFLRATLAYTRGRSAVRLSHRLEG